MSDARGRWSYSTGEWGRNRVRAFEHPKTGRIFLEFADAGKRTRVALGHRDREAAKGKAEEVAAALRRAEAPMGAAPTLQMLFDNYVREVTPQKGKSKQQHDRRAARMFLEFVGMTRRAHTLNRRDWDAFITWRRHGSDGRVGRVRGAPVRNRIIAYDLRFLLAVLNWATMARDNGAILLDRNPLKGLPVPVETSPQRPMLTLEQYRALLAASARVNPLLRLALVLAHETGHRIGAVRLLLWSDVNWEDGKIRWRCETDKIRWEHTTPISVTALEALAEARRQRPSLGGAWVFPAPGKPSEPCSRHLLRDWWQRAEVLAGIPHSARLGWHALRRQWATDMKAYLPLKDLCELGGWKDPQTVLKCYQKADEGLMREALEARRTSLAGGTGGPIRHRIPTPRPQLRVIKSPA